MNPTGRAFEGFANQTVQCLVLLSTCCDSPAVQTVTHTLGLGPLEVALGIGACLLGSWMVATCISKSPDPMDKQFEILTLLAAEGSGT